jgi:hypothetical protein
LQQIEKEYIKFLIIRNKAYHDEWLVKDDSDNFAQTYSQDIIKTAKRVEVESEVSII